MIPRSTERLLRRILKQTTDADPIWSEPNDEAAKALGVDRSTLVRSVARLRKAGLLQPLDVEGGRGRPSEYRVNRARAAECLKLGRLPEREVGPKPRDNAHPSLTSPSAAPGHPVNPGVTGAGTLSSELSDRLVGLTLGTLQGPRVAGAPWPLAKAHLAPLGPTWLGRQWAELGRDGQLLVVLAGVAGGGIGGAVGGLKGGILCGLLGAVAGAGLVLAFAPAEPQATLPPAVPPTPAPASPLPESRPVDAVIEAIVRSCQRR